MSKENNLKKITEKNTKAEILKAYYQLVENMQKKKNENSEEKTLQKNKTQKENNINKSIDEEKIVLELTNIKLKFGEYLSEIEKKLVEKIDFLKSINEKIEQQNKKLNELYKIEYEADILYNILEEQENLRKSIEEEKENIQKNRKREEEEYQYTTKQKRLKEEEEFRKKLIKEKENFEKEIENKLKAIEERENKIKEKEDSFKKLQKEVENFPVLLNNEIKKVEKRVTEEIERKYEMEKIIMQKDIEKEREMFKLEINTYKERIKEMDLRIKSLEKDLKDAISQSQKIASKALEGITGVNKEFYKESFQNKHKEINE